jgi:hypothetical protein
MDAPLASSRSPDAAIVSALAAPPEDTISTPPAAMVAP